MASKYYYLSGKAKWARLYSPDDMYKNYKIDVALDDESKAVFKESGMTMKTKVADDGEYITFRRPESKVIKDELVKFDPPLVTDVDGQKIDALVGNGSDVTIKVVVYDTVKGKGHRLEAVRVDNLIPYEKPQEAATTATVAAAATTAASKGAVRKAMPF